MESGLSVSNMPDPLSSPLERQQSSANGNGGLDSEEGSSLEEIGFNWGEYLEETGASAAPHTSFKHVEISLQSNFQPGMKLEVANKNNPDTYWVATVITTCGQLLLLRYCGYGEDRRADFWCDVVIADLHPVGWCTQNNKALMPPDGKKPRVSRRHGRSPCDRVREKSCVTKYLNLNTLFSVFGDRVALEDFPR
uniref:Scm-like with four MBT domains protein 2 n=1 Tax=Panthera tigris altaica TaxID=74533 RepID=A0A8C9JF05_PANTA